MSDGFKEYYGEIALQQIEELKNRLSEKEEENSKQKQKLEENSTKLNAFSISGDFNISLYLCLLFEGFGHLNSVL